MRRHRWGAMVVLVLVLGGCGDRGEELRRKEASVAEDKLRRQGGAATVTARGSGSTTLVIAFQGEDMCSDEGIKDLASSKSPVDPDPKRLVEVGFTRLECEGGGVVHGVDLPYVKRPRTPAEERARQLEYHRNAAKALQEAIRAEGGTDKIEVRGDGGEIVFFTSKECSKQYLETWLSTRPFTAADGYTRLECDGLNGQFSLDVPSKK